MVRFVCSLFVLSVVLLFSVVPAAAHSSTVEFTNRNNFDNMQPVNFYHGRRAYRSHRSNFSSGLHELNPHELNPVVVSANLIADCAKPGLAYCAFSSFVSTGFTFSGNAASQKLFNVARTAVSGDSSNQNTTPIPEPSSAYLLGAGAFAIAIFHVRRFLVAQS